MNLLSKHASIDVPAPLFYTIQRIIRYFSPVIFKKIIVESTLSLFKFFAFIGRILAQIGKKIFLLVYWIAKIFLRKPLLIAYSFFLKSRAHFATLGITIRNPLISFFSSKSLGHGVIIVCAFGVALGNLAMRDESPDSIQPNSMLSHLVLATDEEYIDEYAPSTPQETAYMPVSGVKQSGETFQEDEAPHATPGDIALNSSALIKPILPTTEAAKSSPNALQYYAVKAGDTIGAIAQKFGLKTSTLLWTNNLTLTKPLQIGQTLTILPTNGLLYKVRRGDSLAKIAHFFQTDSQEIIAMNNLRTADDLVIGQLLILPNGVKPQELQPQGKTRLAQAPTILGKLKKIFLTPTAPSSIRNLSRLLHLFWPTTARRITQYYSWHHSGVDIAGPPSSQIFSAADGVVIIAGWQRGYGKTIVIDHGNGNKTRYGHASKLFVEVGEYVTQGQTIAMVGSTGRSTGPHLHFEVYYHNVRTNPLGFIR